MTEFPVIELNEDGFSITHTPEARSEFSWKDISSILGYKLDCKTDILNVLEFHFDTGHFIDAMSNWDGFEALCEGISSALDGLDPSWTKRLENMDAESEPMTIYDSHVNND